MDTNIAYFIETDCNCISGDIGFIFCHKILPTWFLVPEFGENIYENVLVSAENVACFVVQWFFLYTYRVEVDKTTAASLVAKFRVKAGGDSNANRAALLVF